MHRPIAGQRLTQPREQLVVDYADVLAQAVANERDRTLREIRRAVRSIPVRTQQRDRYTSDDRTGPEVKADILATLDRLEEAAD